MAESSYTSARLSSTILSKSAKEDYVDSKHGKSRKLQERTLSKETQRPSEDVDSRFKRTEEIVNIHSKNVINKLH